MTDQTQADAAALAKRLSEIEAKNKELETDNFKYRDQLREFKTKLELEALDKKKIEETRLREANDYKSLADKYKQEAEEHAEKLKTFAEREKEVKKNTALLTELSKFGFDPQHATEAFKLIDRTRILIDEETNRVFGADEVAKEAATKFQGYPWFNKKQIGVNHAGSTNNKPTLDVKTMSSAEIRKYYLEKQKGR